MNPYFSLSQKDSRTLVVSLCYEDRISSYWLMSNYWINQSWKSNFLVLCLPHAIFETCFLLVIFTFILVMEIELSLAFDMSLELNDSFKPFLFVWLDVENFLTIRWLHCSLNICLNWIAVLDFFKVCSFFLYFFYVRIPFSWFLKVGSKFECYILWLSGTHICII